MAPSFAGASSPRPTVADTTRSDKLLDNEFEMEADLPPEFQYERGEKIDLEPEISLSFTHGSKSLPRNHDNEGNFLYRLSKEFRGPRMRSRFSDFATAGDSRNPGIARFFKRASKLIWIPNSRFWADGNRDGEEVTITGDEGVSKDDETFRLHDLGGLAMFEAGNEPSRKTVRMWAEHPRSARNYQKELKKRILARLENETGPVIHFDVHDGGDFYYEDEKTMRHKYIEVQGNDQYMGVPLAVFSDLEGRSSAPGEAERLAEYGREGYHYVGVEPGKVSGQTGARIWPDVRANDPYKGKAIMELIASIKQELIDNGESEKAARLHGFQVELNRSLYAMLNEPDQEINPDAVNAEAMVLAYTMNTYARRLRSQLQLYSSAMAA